MQNLSWGLSTSFHSLTTIHITCGSIQKDEVFDHFLEMVGSIGKVFETKTKVLRTDNSGEYMSTKFEDYLNA